MAISRDDVIAAYEAFLARSPENEDVIQMHLSAKSVSELLAAFKDSPEFLNRMNASPFWHYQSSIDAVGTILAHENHGRCAVQGHRVNYLGVAVNVAKFFPALRLDECIEPPPIPANWHADIAEFAGALRAVDLSGDTFTIIELGCGWGCWMNNTGIAARRAGKAIHLIGIEGDKSHIGFAREALETNGFLSSQCQLVHGIAAAESGTALFPTQAGGHWGLEPLFNVEHDRQHDLIAAGTHEALPMVALGDVIAGHTIDLLHVDIQGGEANLVRSCLDLLSAQVAYVLIGTHSREIEGELFRAMSQGGWALEIDRPAILTLANGTHSLSCDGVQAWRNTKLRPLS
jgi:hypothetical protein